MDTEVMREALQGSSEGRLTFPQVVGMLAGVGVESYCVDFIAGADTFYMADGRTHAEAGPLEATAVAEQFSAAEVIAAIRAAQADTIRYPEFVSHVKRAGVAGYRVFLSGRKVVYFGRKGELHIEEFPRQN
jgi:uncharacterized protein YbcV (DUF1398 family)